MTISTTIEPATDLGFLLYKHPERAQTFEIAAGVAHVFYPEASDDRATAAMLLEIDPVRLVRGYEHTRRDKWTLDQYVNDRPYVASSFLSVAIREVYGTALAGNCSEKPELARTEIPLQLYLSALPAPDEQRIHDLFEPLGYQVETEAIPLDPEFPAWGDSPYFEVTLTGEAVLNEALSQLYVLAPVLDGDKHYWVDESEVDKLVRHGDPWLADHPERDWILWRYLKYQRDLVEQANQQLPEPPPEAEPAGEEEENEEDEAGPLHIQRRDAVVEKLLDAGAGRVLDLGCGEGKLMERLRRHSQITEIFGVDVSWRALKRAARRLDLTGWPDIQDERVKLAQSSLLYRDRRLEGYDAAVLMEVIEHFDPAALATLEHVVFEQIRPRVVIITTPNEEYNAAWETLPAGDRRHEDHRFEWTRAEFRAWAEEIESQYGYDVEHRGIGEPVENIGTPTQMGVFRR